MTQAHNASQLLDITLRELSNDPKRMLPMANSFIDQWVRALGAGHLLEDNIADELEQLKHALAEGRPAAIGESASAPISPTAPPRTTGRSAS